jgi:hypothetical protein
MSDITYFTIDIENRGDSAMHNGIVSIGVCIAHGADDPAPEKHRFDLAPLPGQVFEERCLREFWHCNDEMRALLARLTANPMPALEGIAAFRALLDRFENPVILSDNSSYDFGFINYYLDVAGLPSLRYDATRTKYIPLYDTDCYARGATHMSYDDRWVDDAVVAQKLGDSRGRFPSKELVDHMPENDAEYIWRMHMAVIKNNGC